MEEVNIKWKLIRPGQVQVPPKISKKAPSSWRARTCQSTSGCCTQWVHCGYELHKEIMCSETVTEMNTKKKNHPQHEGKSEPPGGQCDCLWCFRDVDLIGSYGLRGRLQKNSNPFYSREKLQTHPVNSVLKYIARFRQKCKGIWGHGIFKSFFFSAPNQIICNRPSAGLSQPWLVELTFWKLASGEQGAGSPFSGSREMLASNFRLSQCYSELGFEAKSFIQLCLVTQSRRKQDGLRFPSVRGKLSLVCLKRS